MKSIKISITFILATLILTISCSEDERFFAEEENEISESLEEILIEKIQVIDGRLYFPNKATFTSYYNETKSKDEEQIAEMLENKFYSREFYSLRPIVNDKTEEL